MNILFYQILVFIIHGKILNNPLRTINLKFQLQHEMKNFNYLMDHIIYQIQVFLNVY